MTKAAPWFAFYPSDWLAGTRHLSPAETGVYITLIAMMYEREGTLKDDPTRLARLCNMPAAGFKKAIEVLVDDGKLERLDGQISNVRVCFEIQKRSKYALQQAQKANARWAKKPNDIKETVMPRDKSGNAETMLTTTTTTVTKKEEESIRANKPSDDISKMVEVWNLMAAECGLGKVQRVGDKRERSARIRLKELGGMDGWAVCMDKIRNGPWLLGKKGDWKCTFDWILNPNNLTKVMEGNYDNNQPSDEDAVDDRREAMLRGFEKLASSGSHFADGNNSGNGGTGAGGSVAIQPPRHGARVVGNSG